MTEWGPQKLRSTFVRTKPPPAANDHHSSPLMQSPMLCCIQCPASAPLPLLELLVLELLVLEPLVLLLELLELLVLVVRAPPTPGLSSRLREPQLAAARISEEARTARARTMSRG